MVFCCSSFRKLIQCVLESQVLLLMYPFLSSILSVFVSCILELYYYMHMFMIVTAVALTSIWFDIIIATSALLWLLFSWYILFYLFAFNLFMSLNIQCVSCRQHIVGSWFFLSLTINAFYLECLIHPHLRLLLIWLDSFLPFYFMLSICLVSLHFKYVLLFLVSIVSVKESAVNLIGGPLCEMSHFPLVLFKIFTLSLFSKIS